MAEPGTRAECGCAEILLQSTRAAPLLHDRYAGQPSGFVIGHMDDLKPTVTLRVKIAPASWRAPPCGSTTRP